MFFKRFMLILLTHINYLIFKKLTIELKSRLFGKLASDVFIPL